MPLELIAWNPRKKRRKSKAKKSRGFSGVARKRRRKVARTKQTRVNTWGMKGGPTVAKSKKKRRRRSSGGKIVRTANTSPPPSGKRRRRFGGGGGGGGRGIMASIKDAFSVRTLVEGVAVGAAVAGSGIATQKLVAKFKPDLAANPYLMSAGQVGIGVAGMAILRAIGLRQYAQSWLTGSVAGAALNVYGAVMAQRQANRDPGTMAGMRGLAGTFGPSQSPGFAPSTVSRMAYAG